MKKKYYVIYTWHSGECFGATDRRCLTVDLYPDEVDAWQAAFEDDAIDGSYCSIDSIKEMGDAE